MGILLQQFFQRLPRDDRIVTVGGFDFFGRFQSPLSFRRRLLVGSPVRRPARWLAPVRTFLTADRRKQDVESISLSPGLTLSAAFRSRLQLHNSFLQ